MKNSVIQLSLMAALWVFSMAAAGHGVDGDTRAFIQVNNGPQPVPFMYIGAKHMITGYDHLLFLVGVIFFLYRARDVLLYVSLFTFGHVITLLSGVLGGFRPDAFLIDAVIGFSVLYKGFDNLGGFRTVFGFQPDARLAVWLFGLVHGVGLATKLQELGIPEEGLLINLIAFNVGVELGQVAALGLILIGVSAWRRSASFQRFAVASNALLMALGLMLVGFQLTGYFLSLG